MPSQPVSPNPTIETVQKVEPNYPSARYFQIHFEFLQEQFQQTLTLLESLQARMQRLEQQLASSTPHRDIYPSPLQSMLAQKEDVRSPWDKAGRR